MIENKIILDKSTIANKFIELYTNIGWKLASWPSAERSAVWVSAVELRGKDSVGEVLWENVARQLHNLVWPHRPKGSRLLIPTYSLCEDMLAVVVVLFFLQYLIITVLFSLRWRQSKQSQMLIVRTQMTTTQII